MRFLFSGCPYVASSFPAPLFGNARPSTHLPFSSLEGFSSTLVGFCGLENETFFLRSLIFLAAIPSDCGFCYASLHL